MNRRRVLSAIGTAGVGAGIVWVAYQADQGNIDLGEEAAVSEHVDRSAESFEFEAEAGAEIHVTISEEREGRGWPELSLRDPEGDEVVDTGIRGAATDHTEWHTAERDGTYRLVVDPDGGRFRVTVSVDDADG